VNSWDEHPPVRLRRDTAARTPKDFRDWRWLTDSKTKERQSNLGKNVLRDYINAACAEYNSIHLRQYVGGAEDKICGPKISRHPKTKFLSLPLSTCHE